MNTQIINFLVVLLLVLQSCLAPVFSDLQSARLVGKKTLK